MIAAAPPVWRRTASIASSILDPPGRSSAGSISPPERYRRPVTLTCIRMKESPSSIEVARMPASVSWSRMISSVVVPSGDRSRLRFSRRFPPAGPIGSRSRLTSPAAAGPGGLGPATAPDRIKRACAFGRHDAARLPSSWSARKPADATGGRFDPFGRRDSTSKSIRPAKLQITRMTAAKRCADCMMKPFRHAPLPWIAPSLSPPFRDGRLALLVFGERVRRDRLLRCGSRAPTGRLASMTSHADSRDRPTDRLGAGIDGDSL